MIDKDGYRLNVGIILSNQEGILREDVAIPAMGMPRDLDGDNVVDGVDHKGDYRMLPVIVRSAVGSKN